MYYYALRIYTYIYISSLYNKINNALYKNVK